jgi:hypothetical protein
MESTQSAKDRARAAYEAALAQARAAAYAAAVSALLTEEETEILTRAAEIVNRINGDGLSIRFTGTGWRIEGIEYAAPPAANTPARQTASAPAAPSRERTDWVTLYNKVIEQGGTLELRYQNRFYPIWYKDNRWECLIGDAVYSGVSVTDLGKSVTGWGGFAAPRHVYVKLGDWRKPVAEFEA